MKIRKRFTVESAHIVRNCTSHRCSHSIHGHSAVIDVFLEGFDLDNAHMLYDFGLMKGTIKQLIDSMDHCYILCSKDSDDFRNFIKSNCDRWIELPFNPSAECLSMFVHRFINLILPNTQPSNGEGSLICTGVRYHETTTGWAESSERDMEVLWNEDWMSQIKFSDGVVSDWSDDLKGIVFENKMVVNPIIKQQINLD